MPLDKIHTHGTYCLATHHQRQDKQRNGATFLREVMKRRCTRIVLHIGHSQRCPLFHNISGGRITLERNHMPHSTGAALCQVLGYDDALRARLVQHRGGGLRRAKGLCQFAADRLEYSVTPSFPIISLQRWSDLSAKRVIGINQELLSSG